MRQNMFPILIGWILLSTPSFAEEPFRLNEAFEHPDWLSVSGETRLRHETLDGQFRRNGTGGDQLLLARSLLKAEADAGRVVFGAELQDSRTWFGDSDTPLSNSITNPLDFLQAYIRIEDLPGMLGEGSVANVTLGRQTVSIGSKRQIERVDYANVIKSYTGAHYISKNPAGDEFHAIYVVPVRRFPSLRSEVDDNVLSADEEEWERRIFGLHYRKADILPETVPGLWGELFVYGLEEKDSGAVATPDRSYVSPGLRLYRKPKPGQWDIDLEATHRSGTRYATSDPQDTDSLKVEADMLFAAFGYTFENDWQTRIAGEYYYASGDENPFDDRFDQHERLFGSRRSDLNNTSIHGPLTPANLNAPGFRIEAKPAPRWDGRVYYHAAYLASDTDQWVIAKLRDETGQSGDFLGHVLDGRVRYWVVPDSLRLEVGGSAFLFGEFVENVPEGPEGDRTLLGYTQLTLSF